MKNTIIIIVAILTIKAGIAGLGSMIDSAKADIQAHQVTIASIR